MSLFLTPMVPPSHPSHQQTKVLRHVPMQVLERGARTASVRGMGAGGGENFERGRDIVERDSLDSRRPQSARARLSSPPLQHALQHALQLTHRDTVLLASSPRFPPGISPGTITVTSESSASPPPPPPHFTSPYQKPPNQRVGRDTFKKVSKKSLKSLSKRTSRRR